MTNVFTHFYLQIGHTFHQIGITLRDLAIRLGQFLWMLTRDLFAPVASLALSAAADPFSGGRNGRLHL